MFTRSIAVASLVTLLAVGAFLSLGLSGCKEKVKKQEVTGKVTYNDKPVASANLMFHYEAEEGAGQTTAVTDADGNYTAMLPAGSTTVTITKNAAGGDTAMTPEQYADRAQENGTDASPVEETKSLIPVKYASPKTSQLTADIKDGGENKFDFALKD